MGVMPERQGVVHFMALHSVMKDASSSKALQPQRPRHITRHDFFASPLQ
jgi:hypothetical protein